MKRKLNSVSAALFTCLLIFTTAASSGQNEKAVVKKYLSSIPKVKLSNAVTKYRMTAVYTNRDMYGNFTGKMKVSGDYTRGLENGIAVWNNVFFANASKENEPFPEAKKQEYMENFRYVPSGKMVSDKDAFKGFPASVETVYAKNLVWDMLSFELFAWTYLDSLHLNKTFIIPDINGEFDMAEVGKYSHNKILLNWTGITAVNGELCAAVNFDAIDNKIELKMEQIKSRGTEQYWGTVLVSLKTRNIEHAVMYSGTIQEIEVNGMKDKFLVKTIRELDLERIQ